MKKSFILASVLLAGAATASAFTPADPIEKGARIADAGIGVGAITNSGGPDKAMFTQRIAFEYIIKDDLRIFGQPFSIGVGLAIDNGVSGKTDRVQIIGNYDYSYNSVNYGWRRDPTTGLRTTVSEKRQSNAKATEPPTPASAATTSRFCPRHRSTTRPSTASTHISTSASVWPSSTTSRQA